MSDSSFIPVNTPLLSGNEKKYLNECIDSGWISSEGPFVKRFEHDFSKKVGRRYGIAVSSGTAALDIAIQALEIQPNDEVIVPSFTIISCIHQILRIGAKPIFIDSDINSWNMDTKLIESKITDKTKAILAVHIYGLPVDLAPIEGLAKKYKLKVIEDAAQMIGQTYKKEPCGSFGHISTFSFYPNKHITTGEGGMILTDDPELAEKCKGLRNLCFDNENRFMHTEIGWNYRLTNLQAAVGLAQLEQLDKFIEIKRKNGALYNKLLSKIPNLTLPLDETAYAKNIYWVFGILLDRDHHLSAKDVMTKLAEFNIGSRPFFFPLHLQPPVTKRLTKRECLPVSEHLHNKGLYIPSGLSLSNKEINYVSSKLSEILS